MAPKRKGETMGTLSEFSSGLEAAVVKAGASTVLVDARKRFPASGIAVAPDLVLTADHVVTRDTELKVRTVEGKPVAATIAGRDPGSDLAVLRVAEKVLSPAGRSASQAKVGQLVLALGRPAEDGIQASWGIVTAIGGPARTGRGGLLDKYIQTETTPYPGFSGGPLIDTEGGVLGLNTSGLTRGGALTIPVDVAWPIAEALATHGSVKRGYLGVRTQPVEPPNGGTGVLILWVEDAGPAATAGLLVGDIITAIAGRQVRDPDDIFSSLTSATVGKPVEVSILRGGKPEAVRVQVGERK
jgi:S1-C subfamily serine protease